MRGKRIILFIIMIALGLTAGLIYGWIINPVKVVNASPALLRADYKADYVLMIAAIYHSDQNRQQAVQRLGALGSQPPARIAADAVLTARQLGYAAHDLELMDALAKALQGTSVTPTAGRKP